MAKKAPVKISTENKKPQMREHFNSEKGDALEIEVTVQGTVSETLEEAATWYGGEDKLIASINADQLRRQANAARPLLRDAEQMGDWTVIAQEAVDGYTPGRAGGFKAPTVDRQELDALQGQGIEAMLAFLRQKGVKIVSGDDDTQQESTTDELDSEPEDEDEELRALQAELAGQMEG